MSSGESGKKKDIKQRKKRKSKRPATSPLNDNERPGKSGSLSCNGDRSYNNNNSDGNFVNGNVVSNPYKQCTTGYNFENTAYIPNMAFSQPFGGFPFSTQSAYPNPSQSPTMPSMPSMVNTQPPEWASVLMNDVKAIKSQVSKIEGIEKTVNQICGKIKELESNVSSIDSRLSSVENSCSFISNQHDDHKKELEETKSKLKTLKSTCNSLEKKTVSLEKDKSSLESKINDLEYRSMRDNLMFYGLPEQENENCENVIKGLIGEKLQLPQAGNLAFDRVHRVGVPARGKVRPIVAKFHYFKERELVRNKSFELADNLKAANIGIGAQWPKQMRDARKTLSAVMAQEKAKGNVVKLVRDKLYINGQLYKPDESMITEDP